MILWLAASLASARPIDRPEDHQLQDDARRQPELGVERQQQELQNDRGRGCGVEDHRHPGQVTADESPGLTHRAGGPDVHPALARPQVAEFDDRHARGDQEGEDAEHPHRDGGPATRRPSPRIR